MTEREAAARRGQTTYEGKPCRRGHGGTRYVVNSECVDCARAAAKRRRAHLRSLREQANSA